MTNKVPNIRFKGFTDDWEQRKLGEVGIAKSGVGFPDTEQGGVEGIPFFKVSDMNIKGNENELVAANNYVTVEQVSRKKWNVINDVPAIFFAKVGAAVMLNRKRLVRFPFLLDNNTMAYVFNKNVWDCDFGKTLFETLDLTKLTQVGALPSYNASDVENIRINIPNKCEQQKVGEYFSNLDRLITLHQRKLFEAKNNPKNGSKNFFRKIYQKLYKFDFNFKTYDWEQRKVEGYASFLTGSGLSWDDISEDGEQECILYGNLYTDYGMITDKVVYKTNTKVNKPVYSKFGDVLIPASDTTPTGLARATSLEKSDVLLGGDINIIRPNEDINGSCLSLALNANKKKLIRLIKGTTVRHIHNSDIKGIELSMSKSKAEQTMIAEYFKSLDNLITLHQREVFYTLKHIFYRCCDTLLSGGL